MKARILRIGKLFLFAIPLLMGLYGYVCVEGIAFPQALYTCLGLYGMGHGDPPPNLWIEVARWLAPLATASGLLLIVQRLKAKFRNFMAYCTGESVAVFGSGEEQEALLQELGRSGIAMTDKPVKAHRYILLGTEEKNLEFYQRHRQALSGRDVYIKCRNLPALASSDPKLHLFCPEETAARDFWKTYCPYELSVRSGHHFKIAIVGFEKLGKELLLSALQNNIFHPNQRIDYHIFGQEKGFSAIYHQLDRLSDPVHFHAAPWHAHMTLLREAEMVIITDLPDQLAILRDLTLALPQKDIHILASQQQGAAVLQGQSSRIHIFDWQARSRKKDAILGTQLYERAMGVNLRYAHLYAHVEETPANKLSQWAALDTFARYSNIRTADYHDIRKRIVRANGWAAPLSKAQLEDLAELEHIRWCRYHYLNNWRVGTPNNGKAKDPDARIHRSLIPYAKLTEAEKEKDREVLDILFDLSPL